MLKYLEEWKANEHHVVADEGRLTSLGLRHLRRNGGNLRFERLTCSVTITARQRSVRQSTDLNALDRTHRKSAVRTIEFEPLPSALLNLRAIL
jgi:hypothetical protein